VVQDLNTKAGREFYGLGQNSSRRNVVPLRVREGTWPVVLNLNRAQKPRLLGVKPELLAGRFTFASAAKGLDRQQGWELLRIRQRPTEEGLTDRSPIADRQSKISQSLLTSACYGERRFRRIGDANSSNGPWARRSAHN